MRRSGLLLLLSLLALGLLGAVSAAARSGAGTPTITRTSPLTRGTSYLALGDSVTFGYQEASTIPAPDYTRAASFPGYPEQIASQLHVRVINLACPGETSASLIDARAQSNGCENGYRKLSPLHVRYQGSQLAYAVSFLRSHPGVRLVSLMIGANDFFLCQKQSTDNCLGAAEQKRLTEKISGNVHRILSAIRGQAHYRGQLAILSYFSLNYSSALINAVVQNFNRALDTGAKPFGVVYASGYREFQTASVKYAGQPCLAGLITQLGGKLGNCGVHPTYSGQALLAAAVLKAIRL